ncbi:MAG: SDR family NAD(P)-dependent oxidoreductase [Myxococcota bacterium]
MARPPLDGTILVTGASSGIGAAFARQLAPTARHLVLVARRAEALAALRDELVAAHPALRVTVAPCDLARPAELDALVAQLAADRVEVDVLVNNAGIGDMGLLDGASRAKLDQMLQLNVLAVTQLTLHLYPGMVARGRGGVLFVSSGFGLVLFPGFAAYVGTKHYVTGFADSLRVEAAGTGVCVTQACPGPVRTGFEDGAENRLGQPIPPWIMITPECCARDTLSAFRAGRALVVPGWLAWFGISLGRLTPRWLLRLVFAPIAWEMRRRSRAATSPPPPR